MSENWKNFYKDDMTWKACMSSEVFREYLNAELAKEAAEQSKENQLNKVAEMVDQDSKTLEQLEELQRKVSSDSVLRKKLKQARDLLNADPELAKKVDRNFINGLQYLFLDEDDDDI